MKIVVFGGSGFVGSHVADELTSRGHDVTLFDSIWSPYKQDNQTMVVADICDYQNVFDVIKGSDIVYNFAADADIDNKTPLLTLQTNIMGNVNIVDSCFKCNVKRFVFASTVYVNSKYGSFYATSKKASELIIKDYNDTFKLPYTILRYGSLYGPRANKFNWIYKAIHQALTENKITRKGDGEELREYIHVKDAAKLSVDILDNKYKNHCITITGNQQLKIKDLHVMIKEIINKDIKLEYTSATDWKSHYEITPYTFQPQTSKKLVSNEYYDLGAGLLECINEIYKEIQNEKNLTSQ